MMAVSMTTVVVTFPVAVMRYLITATGSHVEGAALMVQKAWGQEHEDRKQREMNTEAQLTFFFYSVWSPSPWTGTNHM